MYEQNSLTIQEFQNQIQKPILTEKNYFSYYLQSNTSTTVKQITVSQIHSTCEITSKHYQKKPH